MPALVVNNSSNHLTLKYNLFRYLQESEAAKALLASISNNQSQATDNELEQLPTDIQQAIQVTAKALKTTKPELLKELTKKVTRLRSRTLIHLDPPPRSVRFKSNGGFINCRARKTTEGEKIYIHFSSLGLFQLPTNKNTTRKSYLAAVQQELTSHDIDNIIVVNNRLATNLNIMRQRADYGLFKVFTSLATDLSPRKAKPNAKSYFNDSKISTCSSSTKHVKIVLTQLAAKQTEAEEGNTTTSKSNFHTPVKQLKPSDVKRKMPKTPANKTAAIFAKFLQKEQNDEIIIPASQYKLNDTSTQEAPAGINHIDPENPYEWLHLIANFITTKAGKNIDSLISEHDGNNGKNNLIVGLKSCNTQMLFVENKIRELLRDKWDVKIEVTSLQIKPCGSKGYSHLASEITYQVSIGHNLHIKTARDLAPSLTFTFHPQDRSQLRPINNIRHVIAALFETLKLVANNKEKPTSVPQSLLFTTPTKLTDNHTQTYNFN